MERYTTLKILAIFDEGNCDVSLIFGSGPGCVVLSTNDSLVILRVSLGHAHLGVLQNFIQSDRIMRSHTSSGVTGDEQLTCRAEFPMPNDIAENLVELCLRAGFRFASGEVRAAA